jgi:ectoine hydroxylase-related dioxygenase (phytanoyl-CoA dioxygenase family)
VYLTNEQKSQFEDKGFIVIKGFFSDEVMTRVRAWLQEMQNRPLGDRREARYYEQSVLDGESILVRIERVFQDSNKEFRDLLVDRRTTEILTELLGESPVLFKEKANYKLSGCRADKLHQDQAAGWNAFTDFFISLGIVVDPNRKDNGALSFMSSGNYDKKLMVDEWLPLTEGDPPYQPEGEYVLLEADPGDVIFFDSFVPHGSPPNISDRSRRNLFLTFNRASAGDMRDRYYEEKWQTFPPNEPSEASREEVFRV